MSSVRARIDVANIGHNLTVIGEIVEGAELCAVVKADGYGHGAVRVARAALGAGASWLAVATPAEAIELVKGGIDPTTPILLLSEPDALVLHDAWPDLAPGTRYTVASLEGAAALGALAADPVPVHLMIDTGMHRMGVDPAEAVALATAIANNPALELEGISTHCAVADDPDDPFTDEQLKRFDAALADVLAALAASGSQPPITHAANSAAAIAHPTARRDMVRIGIAMYGVAPSSRLEGRVPLRPALRLSSSVTAVRVVARGEGVSYGRHWLAEAPTRIATVCAGYADGVRRSSGGAGVEVLIRGRRFPIVGAVTMDQLMVAVDNAVTVGDEVVLIGRQDHVEITAAEVAARLGTIGYEVLTGLGPRVRRESDEPA